MRLMIIMLCKEELMMKGKVSKIVAKGTVSILNTFLHVDANSTSCILSYQPKAPKELARFKKKK